MLDNIKRLMQQNAPTGLRTLTQNENSMGFQWATASYTFFGTSWMQKIIESTGAEKL
jgi:hypothetical protein